MTPVRVSVPSKMVEKSGPVAVNDKDSIRLPGLPGVPRLSDA